MIFFEEEGPTPPVPGLRFGLETTARANIEKEAQLELEQLAIANPQFFTLGVDTAAYLFLQRALMARLATAENDPNKILTACRDAARATARVFQGISAAATLACAYSSQMYAIMCRSEANALNTIATVEANRRAQEYRMGTRGLISTLVAINRTKCGVDAACYFTTLRRAIWCCRMMRRTAN
jgi:hypothetical protein